jgi:hypothetical protein
MSFFEARFLEGEYSFFNWKIPKRLLPPLLIILSTKIIGALLVYSVLSIGTIGTFWMDPNRVPILDQNQVFFENLNTTPSWAYTFIGWDSAWYLSILTKGYGFSPQSYAFSPMLPFLGRIFDLLFQNPIVSLAVCSLVFGVLWVPLYQLVAENYMSKRKALFSTLVFGLSPYVFLFTTVVYTEGLFFVVTLSSWYYFKRNKIGHAAGFAALCTLTRITGVVITLPLIAASIFKKKTQKKYWLAFSLLPILALIAWSVYCKLAANDFLAFMHATEWSGMYTMRTLITEGFSQKGLAVFQDVFQNSPAPTVWLTPFAVTAGIAVPGFLIWRAWKIDKPLMLYYLFSYIGVLMFGSLVSLPRYISGLFPLWILITRFIPVNRRTAVLLAAGLFVSAAFSLGLWIDFLNGKFVA